MLNIATLQDNSFLFGTIGYSIPTGDADDAGIDSGLSFGLGSTILQELVFLYNIPIRY